MPGLNKCWYSGGEDGFNIFDGLAMDFNNVSDGFESEFDDLIAVFPVFIVLVNNG
jgi:hypothetical protein